MINLIGQKRSRQNAPNLLGYLPFFISIILSETVFIYLSIYLPIYLSIYCSGSLICPYCRKFDFLRRIGFNHLDDHGFKHYTQYISNIRFSNIYIYTRIYSTIFVSIVLPNLDPVINHINPAKKTCAHPTKGLTVVLIYYKLKVWCRMGPPRLKPL